MLIGNISLKMVFVISAAFSRYCTVSKFKFILEKYLTKIPDEPRASGYTQLSGNDNTSQHGVYDLPK